MFITRPALSQIKVLIHGEKVKLTRAINNIGPIYNESNIFKVSELEKTVSYGTTRRISIQKMASSIPSIKFQAIFTKTDSLEKLENLIRPA